MFTKGWRDEELSACSELISFGKLLLPLLLAKQNFNRVVITAAVMITMMTLEITMMLNGKCGRQQQRSVFEDVSIDYSGAPSQAFYMTLSHFFKFLLSQVTQFLWACGILCFWIHFLFWPTFLLFFWQKIVCWPFGFHLWKGHHAMTPIYAIQPMSFSQMTNLDSTPQKWAQHIGSYRTWSKVRCTILWTKITEMNTCEGTQRVHMCNSNLSIFL